jgi:hypothetical protein
LCLLLTRDLLGVLGCSLAVHRLLDRSLSHRRVLSRRR